MIRMFFVALLCLPILADIVYGPLLYLEPVVEEKPVRLDITIKWTDTVLKSKGQIYMGTISSSQELNEIFLRVDQLKNQYGYLGYNFRTEYKIE